MVERAESASAREVIRELCLDLRLFIDAQHQSAVGRVEIEPNDVAHFVDKQRVGRQLEGFDPVRLQSKGPSDAPHAQGRDAAVPRHAAGAPVGGSGPAGSPASAR